MSASAGDIIVYPGLDPPQKYTRNRRGLLLAGNVLDGLLAVESEANERTQEALDLRRRHWIDDSPLDILRTKLWAFGRKDLGEARPEHNKEL